MSEATQNVDVDPIHWGHVDSRPTSLHGNGAASFERTSLDPAKVTCRLCLTLLSSSEALSWVDRHGDVWRVGEGGLMWTPETAPFPRAHVEKKWGPLRLIDTLTTPAPTGPEEVTVAENVDLEPLLEAVKGLSDDLSEMLGIRYDDPIAVAAAVVSSGYLSDRLAQAWDEGHRFTGYEPERGENPYRQHRTTPAPTAPEEDAR